MSKSNQVDLLLKIQSDVADLKKVQRELDRTTKESAELRKSSTGLKGAFNMGVGIVSVQALADQMQRLVGFARQAIQVNAMLEQTAISFKTITGDAQVGKQLLEELIEFANLTPNLTRDVIDSGKKLVAFGEDAEDVTATLSRLSDIGAGVGINISELAEIYGKARVQGTLFAEDINQLTERGIPIIDEFARLMGVTNSEVKKLGSEGKITFELLEDAFINLTSEGGRFYELSNEQSKTAIGLWSTLTSKFEFLLAELGGASFEPMKNGLVAAIGLVDSLSSKIQQINEFGLGSATNRELEKEAIRSLGGRVQKRARKSDLISRDGITDEQIDLRIDALRFIEQNRSEIEEAARLAAGAFYETIDREVKRGSGRAGNRRTETVTERVLNTDNFDEVEFEKELIRLAEERVSKEREQSVELEKQKEIKRETEKATALAKEKELVIDNQQRKFEEEKEKIRRKSLSSEELLVVLSNDKLEAEAEYNRILNDDSSTALQVKNALEEVYKVELEILNTKAKSQELTAEELLAQQKLAGMRSVGDGKFVKKNDNLSVLQQSRIGVRGQEVFDKKGNATGERRGGLDDERLHIQDIAQSGEVAMNRYLAQVGTVGDQLESQFASIFSSIEQGFSSSIEGLINGTMTWEDALLNIRNTILTQVVSSFATMAAQWITQQILMATVGKSLQAAGTASTVAQSSATTAAWMPAATAASIATYGTAATVGSAMAQAMIQASRLTGFRSGGYTGDGGVNDVAGVVHGKEFVMNALSTMKYRPLLEQMNAGTLDTIAAGSAAQNGIAVSSPESGSGEVKLNLAVVDNRKQGKDFLKSTEGKKAIVTIGSENRAEMGIPT